MRISKKQPFFLSLLLRIFWNQHDIQFDKIEIFDFKHDDEFEENAISSLKLIKELSPKYYTRVQKQIFAVVQSKKPYQDTYFTKEKMLILDCSIKYKDKQLTQIYYAGLMIYISTYHCLSLQGFDIYIEDKERMHKISINAEKKFYNQVENIYPEYKGLLAEKFIF